MPPEDTYRIVRFFERDSEARQTIVRGLTRAQATAHCTDPETSWQTAVSPEARTRTVVHGPWFDGFERE